MDGVADVVFPFRALITEGQLDCATGLFRAKITMGSYDVFFLAFTGHFECDMVARFDPATRTFVEGVWAVMEGRKTPPPLDLFLRFYNLERGHRGYRLQGPYARSGAARTAQHRGPATHLSGGRQQRARSCVITPLCRKSSKLAPLLSAAHVIYSPRRGMVCMRGINI